MRNFLNSSSGLTSIDLSSFDTSKVKDMAYVFAGSLDLKTINVSSFDTSNVTDMEEMFDACNSVEVLDLRSFDTTNVTSYKYFATGCDDLQEILISSSFDLFAKSTTALVDQQYWHDSNLNNLNDYLIGVSGNLDCLIGQVGVKIPFAVYSETDNTLSFYNDYLPDVGTTYNNKAVTNVYTGFDTAIYNASSSSTAPPWHSNRTSLTSVVFNESFTNIKPIATAYWFYNFTNCTEIDGLENLDTSEVTTMAHMFDNCSALTSLNLSGFNTTKVTTMAYMFDNCSGLTSLNLSSFNTSNVTTMQCMFYNCNSLAKLDMSSFNTSNVTNVLYMFFDCISLTSLDVSGFNTVNLADMYGMFHNCSNLTTIYSDDSVFVTTAVTSGSYMFEGCSNLVGGNGTVYSSSRTSYTMAHVDTSSNPGYFTAK